MTRFPVSSPEKIKKWLFDEELLLLKTRKIIASNRNISEVSKNLIHWWWFVANWIWMIWWRWCSIWEGGCGAYNVCASNIQNIQIHSLINKSSFHISSIFVYHLHNLLPTVFHLVFNGICFEPQTFLIKALHNVLNIIKHPIRK